LLQNSQTRNDNATQHKLNAIADGLADIMTHFADQADDEDLRHDIRELRAAVGLEEHESSSENRSGRAASHCPLPGTRTSGIRHPPGAVSPAAAKGMPQPAR